jgi:[protein-PII] uridylyltransferase
MSALMESPAAGVATLRTRFRDGKAALVAHFMQSRPTAPAMASLTRALARHADATINEWAHGTCRPALPCRRGRYGGRASVPHSDVDAGAAAGHRRGGPAANDALRAAVGGFITACWDIGLRSARRCARSTRRTGRATT